MRVNNVKFAGFPKRDIREEKRPLTLIYEKL